MNNGKKFKTSVVIACMNGERTIRNCIESIEANRPDELIIGLDLSTDNTERILERMCKKFKNLKVLKFEKKTGTSTIEKECCAIAKGDIIFLTNADCVVPFNWIEKTLEFYNDESIGAVGGARADIGSENPEAITLGAGNASFRKSLLKEVGNFEPGFLCGEDTEFFSRIRLKGYKVIEQQGNVVLHDHQISGFWKLAKRNFNYGFRGGQIIRKYPQGRLFSKLFVIPVFWIPWRKIAKDIKETALQAINNLGKFFGFLKG